MPPLPAPLINADDGMTPVTVWLHPAQAVRLELVLAHHRDTPCLDDDAIVDAIFETGLRAAEKDLPHHE